MRYIAITPDKILKYNGTTLVKSNVIEKANITNTDYLQSRNINASYVFAKVDNIRGSETSEWEQIYSGSTTFSGTKAITDATYKTLLTVSQTNKSPILRIDGSIDYTFEYFSAGQKSYSYTIDLGRLSIKSGDSLEFPLTHIRSASYGINYKTTVFISYINGILQVGASAYGGDGTAQYHSVDWTATINLTSVSVLPDNVVGGSVINGNAVYLFGETTFNLTDESAVFVTPLDTWTTVLSANISYTKTDSDNNSESYNNKIVVLPTQTFASLAEFKSYCQSQPQWQANIRTCWVGLKNENKRDSQSHLRFDKTFTLYTCVKIQETENDGVVYYFDNASVNLTTTSGTAYKQTDYTYTRESPDIQTTSNDFSIDGNSLMQEETTIDGQEAMPQILAGVINQYKNGRNVVKVTVAYGKFYFIGDNNSVSTDVAYNGEDGDFIKVGDICALYTIRNGNTVPLYQKQNKLPTAFKVTSSNIRYNGNFIINLEMIEHIA